MAYSLSPAIRTRLAALLSEASALAGWAALDLGEISRSWEQPRTGQGRCSRGRLHTARRARHRTTGGHPERPRRGQPCRHTARRGTVTSRRRAASAMCLARGSPRRRPRRCRPSHRGLTRIRCSRHAATHRPNRPGHAISIPAEHISPDGAGTH
jgi:hypothetical protein